MEVFFRLWWASQSDFDVVVSFKLKSASYSKLGEVPLLEVSWASKSEVRWYH